ncbi:MAG: LemA family protein [Synergistaceae bacterium]|nr:LemA family protein [Synergistaceae bacterium]
MAVILITVSLWAISVHNGLVRLSKLKEEAWSGMDVPLKRRAALLPNLAEIVRSRASNERSMLQMIDETLGAVSSASAPDARIEAESVLSVTLRSLFKVADAHPDLKSNAVFIKLKNEASSLENEIQLARHYYNGTVRNFNKAIRMFPAVLISSRLGYSKATMFGEEDGGTEPADVSFA